MLLFLFFWTQTNNRFSKPFKTPFTGGAVAAFLVSLIGSACLLDQYRESNQPAEQLAFTGFPLTLFDLVVPSITGTFVAFFMHNNTLAGFSLAINSYVMILALSTACAAQRMDVIYENLDYPGDPNVDPQDRDVIVAGCALQFIGATLSAFSTAFHGTTILGRKNEIVPSA
jgi:hypothetical protein